MRYITKLTVAATLAVSAISAATSANALVFATFGPTTDERIVWNRQDTGANQNLRNGVLFTSAISAYQPNSAQYSPVKTVFNFLANSPFGNLAGMTGMQTDFSLFGTETGQAVQVSGTNLTQANVNGTFKFVYTGPSFLNANNVLVSTGANLLSGSFANARITGVKLASTAGFGAQDPAQTVTFQSDFINFARAQGETINMNFFNVLQPFGQGNVTNRALPDFRAEVGGQFAVASIPEPGTWALMILGFGGAGAMLRSNRRRALALA